MCAILLKIDRVFSPLYNYVEINEFNILYILIYYDKSF